MFFSEFSKRCPDITVKHSPVTIESENNVDYDFMVVRSIDLQQESSINNDMFFPKTWFSAHNPDSFLSENLIGRINNYKKEKGGFSAIPLMLTFSLQAVNNDLVETHCLDMPPSGEPWRKAEKWLNTIESVDGLIPPNPYTHSPLNHLCRVNKKIVESNCINLNYPDIIEFLQFW